MVFNSSYGHMPHLHFAHQPHQPLTESGHKNRPYIRAQSVCWSRKFFIDYYDDGRPDLFLTQIFVYFVCFEIY